MRKVIFDLDGTLFQTNITLLKAVSDTLMDFQLLSIGGEEINKHIGKTTEEFMKGLFPSDDRLTEFQQRMRYHEQQAIRECGILFPGTKEMLEELKKLGYLLYICSSGSEEYIKLVLQSTGIEQYFEGIHSTKYGPSKREVLKQIVIEGVFAIMIGDTVFDFNGAMEAGIPSVAVSFGYGSEEDCRKATFSADNQEEVLDKILLAELFHHMSDKLFLKNKYRIVSINGVDTSGKTIFTENFLRYLKAVGIHNEILHLDDFHNKAALRCQGENEIDAYETNAFNYRQVIEEVLSPLKLEGKLDKIVCCLNLDTDKYEVYRHYTIDVNTVLLVEGVLLFREPLLAFLEGKVFLLIDFDEVLKRARERDIPKYGEEMIQKYVRKYIPIQKRYLLECKPIEISDIVIDNQNFKRPVWIRG